MVHDDTFLREAERRGEGRTERPNRDVQGNVQGNNGQTAVRQQGLDFDYVIEKTVQLIGYIAVSELELMTPHEWEQMIKGARHRWLDRLEDMRTQSIMFAQLNNGKGVQKINKQLDKERKMINQTETSIDYEKEKSKDFQKRVRAVQRKALQKWLDSKNR